jgi:hypothetical protein
MIKLLYCILDAGGLRKAAGQVVAHIPKKLLRRLPSSLALKIQSLEPKTLPLSMPKVAL